MRLKNINIQNVLGVAHANINAHQSVVLVCGPNGAGKSSIAEAVRFAMLGETPRGSGLKKDYPALLHTGSKAGGCTVQFDAGLAGVALPAGTRQTEGLSNVKGLEFCLSPERFAQLDAKERRAALFDLMGVKVTPATVKERLTVRGVDAKKAEQVLPLLAAGFDAALKEAQAKARDAKAAWRAITGETYGSNKADSWAATVPPAAADAADLSEVQTELAQAEAVIAELTSNLGGMKARAEDAKHRAVNIEHLQAKIEQKARIVAKLEKDTAELADWNAKAAEAEQRAKGGNVIGTACDCPECGASLVFAGGRLQPRGAVEADPEAANRASQYREAARLLDTAVKNGKRDLAEVEKAEAQLQALTEAATEVPSQKDIDAAVATLEAALEKRRRLAGEVEGIKAAIRASEQAATVNAKASAEHQAVQAWEAIAEAFSPNGIPAELLADAVAPFNDKLAQLSDLADWMPVFISYEMGVYIDGKPYEYRSESEKWRADTIIAAAIAQIGGAGFVMLDRFDVLDAKGREDALYLFADWGISALVLGTLKAAPNTGELGIQTEWIQGGTVGAVKEAA